jgi:hypothetical protein
LIHKYGNAAVRVQLEKPWFLLRPFGQVNTTNPSLDVRYCILDVWLCVLTQSPAHTRT